MMLVKKIISIEPNKNDLKSYDELATAIENACENYYSEECVGCPFFSILKQSYVSNCSDISHFLSLLVEEHE